MLNSNTTELNFNDIDDLDYAFNLFQPPGLNRQKAFMNRFEMELNYAENYSNLVDNLEETLYRSTLKFNNDNQLKLRRIVSEDIEKPKIPVLARNYTF